MLFYNEGITKGWSLRSVNQNIQETPLIFNKLGFAPVLIGTTSSLSSAYPNPYTLEVVSGSGRFNNGLEVTGSFNVTGSTTITNNLIVSGNITLGDASTDTITLTGTGGAGTYTIAPLTTSQIQTITVGNITGASGTDYTTSWHWGKEWVDHFPEWSRVQDMCVKYPGLKVAFDNFKVFYEMCKDDYDNPIPKK